VRKSLYRSTAGCALIAAVLLGVFNRRAEAEAAEDAVAELELASQVLTRAFDNLYYFDMTTTLTLVLHDGRGEESIRRAEVAQKRIDGRLHAYGRFLDPPWMRGTAVLVIDNLDRSDDHLLFLPEQRRVRRVTNVQRDDSFLGSDLWYEDLERRHARDYPPRRLKLDENGGEPVFVVTSAPAVRSSYARVEFTVARADYLLLRTAYFKAGSKMPFKTIELRSRDDVVERDGHLIPTALIVTNRQRGTQTEARFEDLKVNPPIRSSLFSAVALESGRKISGGH